MVITLSIIPSFTYSSLSLASHKAIRVLYRLQLFVCPVNDNASYVPYLTGFGDGDLWCVHDLHRDLSSSWCLQSGDDPRCDSPSPRWTLVMLASASTLTRPELHRVVDPSYETFEGISQISIMAEVLWPPACIPNTTPLHHRRSVTPPSLWCRVTPTPAHGPTHSRDELRSHTVRHVMRDIYRFN
jgi:hypothetical protein